MPSITSITLDAAEPERATDFYRALGLHDRVRARPAATPAPSGFPGFTLSALVDGPQAVDRLTQKALAAGATPVKPVTKSLWGYGGVLRAVDGSVWKIATSSKKDPDVVSDQVRELVLLLGSTDVKTSKQFYVDHGLETGRSFSSRYVELHSGGSVKLALYRHQALAKDAGLTGAPSTSSGLTIGSDLDSFTDPDGFAWEAASD